MSHSSLPIAVLAALALSAAPSFGATSSITFRTVADPAGEHTGDEFGHSVAWVGDVNGDGYDDVLVGAFRYPEIASVGQAYLYFGGPAMDTVPDLVITPPAGGSGWFGVSVASAGDFNGDGYPDFIIGAQQAGNEGKAFIYYGGPSLDGIPDVTLTGESTGQLIGFGASVASAGDVNGDGFGDVIVGAPSYPGGNNQPGCVYVFFGGAIPDAVPDRVFTGVGFFDQLGSVVGSAGDMNGDGYPDVFASAPNNRDTALNAGAVYVWFGGPAFDAIPDLTVFGSGVNEHLRNAANAGDINGDGFSDLIGAGRTQVRLWFGGGAPDAAADLTLPIASASVAGAGDVNADGIDDFVIGAPNDVGGGAGRVSIYFGGHVVDTVEDLFYVGAPSTGAIGTCVAGGGHVDGTGPADIITGAYWDPEFVGYNKGRVDVFANTVTDICPGQADGTGCNDGNPCTGGELCGGGVCGGGTPLVTPAVGGSVRLARSGSGSTISWSDPPGPYSVYRGTRSGSPWAYNLTCHDPRVALSSATDAENPSSGTMFYYLVTRVGACGESIPGRDSGGQPNPNPAPCP